MYSKKNPYDHRRPASVDVFVGRNTIVDQLADDLRFGHSYGLIGEAGMGKTSLLFAVKRKLASHWLEGAIPVPIYIEIHKRYLKHERMIFIEDWVVMRLARSFPFCGLLFRQMIHRSTYL